MTDAAAFAVTDILNIKTAFQGVLVLGAAVIVALAKGQITTALEGLINLRHSHLKEVRSAIEHSSLLNDDAKRLLRDQYTAHVLERTTGVYAEERVRDVLQAAIGQSNGQIDWRAIRRGWKYLAVRHGRVMLRDSEETMKKDARWNRIVGWVFFGFFAICVALGILTLLLGQLGGLLFIVISAPLLFLSVAPTRDAQAFELAQDVVKFSSTAPAA